MNLVNTKKMPNFCNNNNLEFELNHADNLFDDIILKHKIISSQSPSTKEREVCRKEVRKKERKDRRHHHHNHHPLPKREL